MIDAAFAALASRTALANVATEYPYKLDQVLGSDDALSPPRVLHPVFHGSYDWHSCVHMHWTLVRLLRLHPQHAHADAARRHLEHRLTADHVRGELATLSAPHRASFERPYGWGWLLKLAAELQLARSGGLYRRAAGSGTGAAGASVRRSIHRLFAASRLSDARRCSQQFGVRAAAGTRLLRGVQHRALHRADHRASQSLVRA